VKAMDHDAIVQHISKSLYTIDDADFELLKSIGLIAQQVLNGKKRLKRSTDVEELAGMVITATWKIAKSEGTVLVIEELKKAIEGNKVLKE